MLLVALLTLVALAIVALLGVSVYDAVAHPSYRRMAFRHIARRRNEAALVTLGSLLGTAIICASFLVGSTFESSVRDGARTQLGPIDETVTVTDVGRLPTVVGDLTRVPLPGTDGVLSTTQAPVIVASVGADRRAAPQVTAGELDFGAARAFGHDDRSTGLERAGPTPSGNEAVINAPLARRLRVRAGEPIDVFAYGHGRRLVVRNVVPQVGLAGDMPLFVPPGTLGALARGRAIPAAAPLSGVVLVSNTGGVFSGADRSSAVTAEVRTRLRSEPAAEVQAAKHDVLADAEAQGSSTRQLFTGVGFFSVVAGILLLVNLFVMLAEERKRELGMLRSIGFKRRHLMRIFGLEGACYALAATVAGVAVGIAVGWGIVQITRGLFIGSSGVSLRFSVPAADLALGGAIGLLISLLTVWITSFRSSRLNVIRAVRDLPEPPARTHRPRVLFLASSGVVLGGLLAAFGVVTGAAFPTLVGPSLAFLCAIPLLRPLAGRRATVVVLAALTLAWNIGVFTFFPDTMSGASIPVFVAMGVIMVGAAVAIASSIDHLWVSLAEHVSRTGHGLAARLGLAYPLARITRTGLLLAMYALIVFTLTFMAVFSDVLGAQAATFTREISAGNDLLVDANPANPTTSAQLLAQPGVASVAPLLRAAPAFTDAFHTTPVEWPISGFDQRLLEHGVPTLSARLPQFGSDAQVFETVLHDPSLAVVGESFLETSGEPGQSQLHVGDTITMTNPSTGATHQFTVAGTTARSFTRDGALISATFAKSFLGPLAVPSRFYVATKPGAKPEAVADQLNTNLMEHGVDAATFRQHVNAAIGNELGYLKLLQGYLALGLVIGIAGLGVVMVRAVRERRRQIGMLRAMGFSSRVVRRSFLFEAAFVAFQGIVIGVGLGLITAYVMITDSSAFQGQTLPYHVPLGPLAILVVVPLVASLLAAVAPASQAAAIRPAAALRIAE